MRKYLLPVIAVLACAGPLVAALLLLPKFAEEPAAVVARSDRFSAYFERHMVTLGVAGRGQPFEGFDAGSLIAAFPGLVAADFDGVEANEGRYSYVGGELSFVGDRRNPVTSAESTVSAKGYATLLANVSSRLHIAITSEDDVDRLIAAVDAEESRTARIGQSADAFGVQVTPLKVEEDSRCPSDVTCIWAGTARVQASVSADGSETTQTLALGVPLGIHGRTVTLESVEPVKVSTVGITPGQYVFHLRITKP